MELVFIILIVLVVAFIFSIVGLGGAIIYVPLFYWLGINLDIAIPTALFLNCITTSSASLTYHRRKMIAMQMALPLIVTSVLFAPIGAYFSGLLDDNLILCIFSVIMVIAGIRMLLPIESGKMVSSERAAMIGIPAGMVIGFTVGLLGLGGGTFVVPLFLMMGLEAKKASATSAVFVLFTSLSGLLGHIGTGTIDVSFMLFAGVAAFIGAQVGSLTMADYMESRTVLKVFGIILLVIGARIIYCLI